VLQIHIQFMPPLSEAKSSEAQKLLKKQGCNSSREQWNQKYYLFAFYSVTGLLGS
jgi:beta-lactam-binding protein with PASTA domain